MASMRQRPTLNAAGNPASQVDIYVSGHGAGANRIYEGLSTALDLPSGRGGGRIQDLGAQTASTYYASGPLSAAEQLIMAALGPAAGMTGTDLATFLLNIATDPSSAGPSAFWTKNTNEERPINDMDYEFDVPLPPQAAGATAPVVEVTRHPEDTTAVNEVITYPNFPTSAHVRLPFKGSAGGIYARTLKFASSAPKPSHYHVQVVEIDAIDQPGLWHMTSDVNGQWLDLWKHTPAFSQVATGQVVSVGADFDVYVNPTDSIWVHVNGYEATPIDTLFATMFDVDAYSQIISIGLSAAVTSTRDNVNLGDAILELKPPLPTAAATTTVAATLGSNPGHFQTVILVEPK
jgi:hypothetical protein